MAVALTPRIKADRGPLRDPDREDIMGRRLAAPHRVPRIADRRLAVAKAGDSARTDCG